MLSWNKQVRGLAALFNNVKFNLTQMFNSWLRKQTTYGKSL